MGDKKKSTSSKKSTKMDLENSTEEDAHMFEASGVTIDLSRERHLESDDDEESSGRGNKDKVQRPNLKENSAQLQVHTPTLSSKKATKEEKEREKREKKERKEREKQQKKNSRKIIKELKEIPARKSAQSSDALMLPTSPNQAKKEPGDYTSIESPRSMIVGQSKPRLRLAKADNNAGDFSPRRQITIQPKSGSGSPRDKDETSRSSPRVETKKKPTRQVDEKSATLKPAKKKKELASVTSSPASDREDLSSKKLRTRRRAGSEIIVSQTPLKRKTKKSTATPSESASTPEPEKKKKKKKSRSRISGTQILITQPDAKADVRKLPKSKPESKEGSLRKSKDRESKEKRKRVKSDTSPLASSETPKRSKKEKTKKEGRHSKKEGDGDELSAAAQFRAQPNKSRSFVMLSTVQRGKGSQIGNAVGGGSVIGGTIGRSGGSSRGGSARSSPASVNTAAGSARKKTHTRKPSVTGESEENALRREIMEADELPMETGESTSRVRIRSHSESSPEGNDTKKKGSWKDRMKGSLSGKTGSTVARAHAEDNMGAGSGIRGRSSTTVALSSDRKGKGLQVGAPDIESIFSPRPDDAVVAKKKGQSPTSPSRLRAFSAAVTPRTAKDMQLKRIVKKGSLQEVEALLTTYADVLLQGGRYGRNALHYACSRPQPDVNIVKHVLSLGADVEGSDLRGWGAIHSLCRSSCSVEVLEVLVEAGAKINAVTRAGDTPLHFVASRPRRGNDKYEERKVLKKMIKMLLKHGAYLEGNNHDAETPLLTAAKKNNKIVARLLIDNGADIHAVNRKGATVLHMAVEADSTDLASLFFRKGVSPLNDRGCGSALGAAQKSQKPNARAILGVFTEDVSEVQTRGRSGTIDKIVADIFSVYDTTLPTSTPRISNSALET